MRILLGINGQQQGHFSRAAELLPELRRRGFDVQTLSSGPPLDRPPAWLPDSHVHLAGLPYVEVDGRTDFAATTRLWVRSLPTIARNRRRVAELIRRVRPDLIWSDFELYTGGPAVLDHDAPVLSVCRQVAVLDPQLMTAAAAATAGRGEAITRTVIRLFAAGADRRLAYHLRPDSPLCLPPLLRSELAGTVPAAGRHLLVYNSQHFRAGGDAETLVDWAARTGRPVRAYGFADHPRGERGGVTFRPASRDGLLADLASAAAVATTAGFALPLEAAILGKPCLVVPLPGQFEQSVNARQLQAAGYAAASDDWDFDRAVRLPPAQLAAADREWLLQPIGAVVDRVLAVARTLSRKRRRSPRTGPLQGTQRVADT